MQLRHQQPFPKRLHRRCSTSAAAIYIGRMPLVGLEPLGGLAALHSFVVVGAGKGQASGG